VCEGWVFLTYQCNQPMEIGVGSASEDVVPKTKTVHLIGTVHVSENSAQKVERVIAEVLPDVVCIELDLQRFKALQKMGEGGHFRYSPGVSELLTLPGVLRWLQQEVGEELGVMPGAEMLSAYQAARKYKLNLALIDRPVQVTINHLLAGMSFGEKVRLGAYIVATVGLFALRPVFGKRVFNLAAMFGESRELDLRKLEKGHGVGELMEELRKRFPTIYKTLVEERNIYMSRNIINILRKADTLVVTVGMGHVSGMETVLRANGIDVRTH